MAKFKVDINRDDYGYIIVEAETKEEAEEKIESGDWTDEEYTVKGGGYQVVNVKVLE